MGIVLDRQRNIAEQVYHHLRQQIIAIELEPGAPIKERYLVAQLGVSRTPIREAVRRLSNEGLIDILPNVGTFVAGIDLHKLEEGRLIRGSLERATIRVAAGRFDSVTEGLLESALRRHLAAAQRGLSRDAIIADDDFHKILVNLSGFHTVWTIVHQAKAEFDRLRHLATTVCGRMAQSVEEHAEILRALKSGDPDHCEQSLQDHLDTAHEVILKVIEEHPEYLDRETDIAAPRLR